LGVQGEGTRGGFKEEKEESQILNIKKCYNARPYFLFLKCTTALFPSYT
jgi:hypothetical protein